MMKWDVGSLYTIKSLYPTFLTHYNIGVQKLEESLPTFILNKWKHCEIIEEKYLKGFKQRGTAIQSNRGKDQSSKLQILVDKANYVNSILTDY